MAGFKRKKKYGWHKSYKQVTESWDLHVTIGLRDWSHDSAVPKEQAPRNEDTETNWKWNFAKRSIAFNAHF